MRAVDIPAKFSVPFANAATAQNARDIPPGSQVNIQPGAASLNDGFPPLNFVAVQAGGVPPFGADMNGILRMITRWNRWQASGGQVKYDSTFSSAVGGYPQGATLISNSGHAIYESLIDNNISDPNTGSTSWSILACVWSAQAFQASGSANLQTVSLNPAPTSMAQMTNIPLRVVSQGTNTAAVTLNVNGLGAVPIRYPGGIQLGPGALVGGAAFEVIYNGQFFVLISQINVFVDGSNQGAGIFASGNVNGANLLLAGNGATTPNKWVRAWNGEFQILSDGYAQVILALNNNGNLNTAGAIQANNGNVTAQNGRLRATFGAYGSGDVNAATLLGDFSGVLSGVGYSRLPNGLLLEWGETVQPVDNTAHTLNFPLPYSSFVAGPFVTPGADFANPGGQVGADAASLTQFRIKVCANTTGGSATIKWFSIGV